MQWIMPGLFCNTSGIRCLQKRCLHNDKEEILIWCKDPACFNLSCLTGPIHQQDGASWDTGMNRDPPPPSVGQPNSQQVAAMLSCHQTSWSNRNSQNNIRPYKTLSGRPTPKKILQSRKHYFIQIRQKYIRFFLDLYAVNYIKKTIQICSSLCFEDKGLWSRDFACEEQEPNPTSYGLPSSNHKQHGSPLEDKTVRPHLCLLHLKYIICDIYQLSAV